MQCLCFIEIHEGIIAFGKDSRDIVAAALRFRVIDHADRTMTTWLLKLIRKLFRIEDKKLIVLVLVEHILPAANASCRHFHPLQRCAPGSPRDDAAVVRTKPDQYDTFVVQLLARELTNIEHTR